LSIKWPVGQGTLLPENYKDMEKGEKDRVANQVERSLVQYLYEIETQKQNPLLVEVNNVAHRVTRRQTIDFGEDTWDGDILPFRQCLIRIERFAWPILMTRKSTNEE
jgi:hypothetical protein